MGLVVNFDVKLRGMIEVSTGSKSRREESKEKYSQRCSHNEWCFQVGVLTITTQDSLVCFVDIDNGHRYDRSPRLLGSKECDSLSANN